MPLESSHQFSAQISSVYGIDYSKLGCVMLKTETIDLKKIAPGIEADLYTSSHPDRDWIHGDIVSNHAHLTLLYGLLHPAYEHKAEVDLLLADIPLKSVQLARATAFETTFEDEDYTCLVAEVQKSHNLVLAHDRLGYLPHVNTFPDYTPHVTLAYVRRASAEHWLQVLQNNLPDSLKAIGLSYGNEKL